MPDLMQQLRRQPQRFDLFQAVSLLQRAHPQARAPGTSLGVDEAVRLSAQVDLRFAPSDVSAVTEGPSPASAWTVSTPVMSLAGAQGPLPTPITELLLQGRWRREGAGLDFLDIFNQRLLALLYRARQKHHLALQPGPVHGSAFMSMFDALNAASGWPRHAGLQSMAPRSMASLLGVLSDRLGLRLQGRQFVGGWQALPGQAQAHLAQRGRSGSALGAGQVLGQRVWDQEAGIEIATASPVSAQVFRDLLPGGTRHRRMHALVLQHLQRPLQVQFSPMPQPAAAAVLSAGASAVRLGLDSWLGQSADPQRPRYRLRGQDTPPQATAWQEVAHGH